MNALNRLWKRLRAEAVADTAENQPAKHPGPVPAPDLAALDALDPREAATHKLAGLIESLSPAPAALPALRAFSEYCQANWPDSQAQLFQDLFVLFSLGTPRGGYFVEFGATDGLEFSNTYLLEKSFGWNGLLAEPARCWHAALAQQRACAIDHRCVWSRGGEELVFNETAEPVYSTIDQYSARDEHALGRAGGTRYAVPTITLNELLDFHRAPHRIDYLSLDTEGSEYEILKAFDFNRHDVRLITVEHNHVEPDRSKLLSLLTAQGFERRFSEISLFDDWYVKP